MRRFFGPEPRYPRAAAVPRYTGPIITVAGPCSLEDEAQMLAVSEVLRQEGVSYARGGFHRAGTYPPPKPGPRLDLLKLWCEIAHGCGIPVVAEVIDLLQLDAILRILGEADALQVGARQMQNYGLLRALAPLGKTVFLKRNMGATVYEWLGSLDYLLAGTARPVMVERGVWTGNQHVRWTLDVSAVAYLKTQTGVPVLVDASHASGRRELVLPLTLAGLAAGADGYLVEVHPDPDASISDAEQALPLGEFPGLAARARIVHAATAPAAANSTATGSHNFITDDSRTFGGGP